MTTASAAGRRSVLLVEDSAGDADLITEMLTAGGHQSIVVEKRLSDGVERLRAQPVDVVLLDLHLPDGSGLECIEAVRKCSPEVPLVVLTGVEDDRLALSCIAAGAQDYLSKQEVRTGTLRRAIAYAIARTRELGERRRADALQERLAAVFDASSDAIISHTVDGVVTSWNHGAEVIFGCRRDEAIGSSIRDLVRSPEGTSGLDQSVGLLPGDDGGVEGRPRSLEVLRRDGRRVTLSVVASELRNPAGDVVGAAAICRDVSESARRDREVRQRNEDLVARDRQMRALATRRTAVREQERARISREVHDELGQLLTGLKLDLRWIGRRLKPGAATQLESVVERLCEAEKLVDTTIETIQRIALELRPSALDALGLPAALRDEARRFARRAGLAATVHVPDAKQPATDDVATTLFRIFQELLTNIARHAHAASMSVSLDEGEEWWMLRVEDDGVGIDPQAAIGASSLGILGVRERAEALGGTVTFERGAGRGTIAIVRVPRTLVAAGGGA